jgi:hypothetical protein
LYFTFPAANRDTNKGNQTMQFLHQRPDGRKRPIVHSRVHFVRVLGFRRRFRWSRPFTVTVHKIERFEVEAQ